MMSLLRDFLFLAAISAGMAANAQEMRWPDEAPGDWLLAFIDVETTGLQPGYHEMIDIGVVMTDLDGTELDRLFIRIQPEHPERTEEGARAVNAFDADRWRELNALSPGDAVERIVGFHQGVAGDRNVLMVAFNSHFDASFLDHLFRSNDRSWRELYHYFVLDLPSMAWTLGIRGLTGTSVSAALGIEDEPHVAELHTGITGAALNARIYRGLLAIRNEARQ
jgi:DNA polymerase III alpha subunit (gram-positive type)